MGRWSQLMDSRVNSGKKMDLNETFVKILFQLIHEDSVRMQTEIMDEE
jgi:chorismate mutase